MRQNKANPYLNLDPHAEPEGDIKMCDHPGCDQLGDYLAPRHERSLMNQPNDYYHFCLEHVREYNQSWSYNRHRRGAALENQFRSDATWERPSWPFGHLPGAEKAFNESLRSSAGFSGSSARPGSSGAAGAGWSQFMYSRDWKTILESLDLFLDDIDGGDSFSGSSSHAHSQGYSETYGVTEIDRAFAVFGVTPPVTAEALKKRYKELVKQYHPDLNPGDREKEDFFKKLTRAYDVLKVFCVS